MGLKYKQNFCPESNDPYEGLNFQEREVKITDSNGEIIFQQTVIFPDSWSDTAVKVVASKYFYGALGTPEREYDVRQLFTRVAAKFGEMARTQKMFKDEKAVDAFLLDMKWLFANQYMAFNSPVWFNFGLDDYGVTGSATGYVWNRYGNDDDDEIIPACDTFSKPQGSACFIQGVEDTMDDIMRLAVSQANLYKQGSGTGTNLSSLRSSKEGLTGGGMASGPLSFMKVYDQIASVIKSGGKTRRAAAMEILDMYHPDIKEFIMCKVEEEKKAWALIEQGYDGSFGGEAYDSVMHQNANLSVSVCDKFMKSALNHGLWQTYGKKGDMVMPGYNSEELLELIAEATHICGDPGVQFTDTINKWHTCKNSGRINASNPCSEFFFIDNSACNLASHNLMKHRTDGGGINHKTFGAAIRLTAIAQELIIDGCSYPTEEIARNSHDFRPLGMGYANLGAYLMSVGIPYDSAEGRERAAAITSFMTANAYYVSQQMASVKGAFPRFEENAKSFNEVMQMHLSRAEISESINIGQLFDLKKIARQVWQRVCDGGEPRNAQVTVLAPTGTIGFMMDCDTTGVEPGIALVSYKNLAGGGILKIVNNTVKIALKFLGYDPGEVAYIIKYIEEHDTIEGSNHQVCGLHPEHLPVFDCAFKPANGSRFISYMGHIKMMAAVQPFLSGAISKTVNMPNDATVAEIINAYTQAWQMGVKALAIYRDGSKRTQPMNLTEEKEVEYVVAGEEIEGEIDYTVCRRKLPETRQSITHRFEIAGHEGYLTVGLFDTYEPGELFITMSKGGSSIQGLMDCFGIAISMGLQHGVPVETLVKKYSYVRFEPAGMTSNKEIPFAKSIVDYIARWLKITFLENAEVVAINNTASPVEQVEEGNILSSADDQMKSFQDDAPACSNCGSITVRNGSCYKCFNCGESLGCS